MVFIKSNGHLYATTNGYGIYKSSNNGNTWIQLSTQNINTCLEGGATINSNGEIFIGTLTGVYKSTDDGNTWINLNLNISVRTIGISKTGSILACSKNEVYRSTNYGTNWVKISTQFNEIAHWSIFFRSNGEILLGSVGSGIYRSSDDGLSWNNISVGSVSTAISESSKGNLYFPSFHGISFSNDNGNTWQWLGINAGWIKSILIKTTGEIFTGDDESGVWYSKDEGKTWTQKNKGMTNICSISNIGIFDSDKIFVSTAGGGCLTSTNSGNDWVQKNNGICALARNTDIMQTGNGNLLISFGMFGAISLSTNKGDTWTTINPGFGWSYNKFAKNSKNDIFVISEGTKIIKSTDDGLTWINSGYDKGGFSGLYCLNIDSKDNLYVSAYGEGIFRSTNSGVSWTKINNPPHYSMTSLVTVNNILFAGFLWDTGIFFSTDFGLTWTQCNNGITEKNIQDLAVNSNNHIFATSGAGLYRSTDLGKNWTLYNSGLPRNDVKKVKINSGDNLFVSLDAELIYKSNYPTVLSAPALSLPTNNSTNVSLSPTLTWTADNNATEFSIQVSSDLNFVNDVIEKAGIKTTSYTLSGLSGSKKYYWRVQATNICAISSWSSTSNFTSTSGIKSISLSSNSLSFGSVYTGLYGEQYLSINNNGSEDITISNVSISGSLSFSITNNPTFPVTLAKDKKIIIITRFSPTTAGTQQATLNISHNVSGGTSSVSLSAEGKVIPATDFWRPTNPAMGGVISVLTSGQNGIVYTVSSGTWKLFYSSDSGLNWQENTTTNQRAIFSIGIKNTGDVFLGCWPNGTLFRSSDNVKTLVQLKNGLSEDDKNDVECISFKTSGEIFIGTGGNGIFLSTDNGESWKQINNGLTNLNIQGITINSNGEVFVATHGGGVFKSTDNGNSWITVNNGLSNLWERSIIIASSGDLVLGSTGGVYYSTDKGNSWLQSSLNSMQIMSLVTKSSGEIFACTRWDLNGGIFKSVDNGRTFTKVNNGLTNINVHILTITSDGDILAGTIGSGVFRSTNNGNSWIKSSNGIEGYNLNTMVMSPKDEIFIGNWGGGVTYSSDDGNTWSEKIKGIEHQDNWINRIAFKSTGEVIFTKSGWTELFISTDNGNSWSYNGNGLPNVGHQAMAVKSNGDIFIGNDNEGISYSTNNGITWSKRNSGLPNPVNIRDIAIKSTGEIFAGAYNDQSADGGGIYKSTNNGISWTQTKSTKNYTNSLKINSSGHIFASMYWGLGVWRSTDNGVSWIECNNGIQNKDIYSLAINSLGHIFAGSTSKDVYRSTDNGDSWTTFTIPDAPEWGISSICLNSKEELFVSFRRGRVYKSAYSTILSTPTLKSPIDKVLCESINPAFTWESVSNASEYEFQYSTNAAFTGAISKAGLTTPSYNITANLGNGLTYYWRVRAINLAVTGNWSTSRSFATQFVAPSLTSPATGSVKVSLTPIFDWNKVDGAGNYILQISASSSDWSKLVFNNQNISTQPYTLPTSLDYSKTYYWRISAINGTCQSSWSQPFSFSTILAVPTLKTPTDKDLCVSINPTCTWDSVSNVTGYEFQYSISTDFTGAISTTGSTTPSYTISKTLSNGVIYYWRVRSLSSSVTSEWSTSRSFTTQFVAPSLLLPVTNSVKVSRTPTFDWNKVEGANVYNLQISESSSDWSKLVVNNQNLSAPPYTLATNLNFSKTYYWRISAVTGNCQSSWSQPFSFSTILAVPILKSPADKELCVSILPDFRWDTINNATEYEFQSSSSNDFSGASSVTGLVNPSYTISKSLGNGISYYWRVRASSPGSSSDWSSPNRFTTQFVAPTLLLPATNSVKLSRTPTFNWNKVDGANSYILQISTSLSDWNNLAIDEKNITTPPYAISTPLDYSKTYYWRISAINGICQSSWSQSFSFTSVDKPKIVLNKSSLTFWASIKGNLPKEQDILITNGGDESLNIEATVDVAWIEIKKLTSGDTIILRVKTNTSDLSLGSYPAKITITDPTASNSPQVVDLTYKITLQPKMQLGKSIILFAAVQNGQKPNPQKVALTNSSEGVMTWTVTKDVDWMDISPLTGSNNDSLVISINRTNLAPGPNNGSITISSSEASNSPQNIAVVYTIGNQPRINTNTTSLTFNATQNGTNPSNQTFTINNGGVGDLIWSISDDKDWLDLSPTSGTNEKTVTVSVKTTNLDPGANTANITITSSGASNSPQTLSVTYNIVQQPKISTTVNSLTFSVVENSSLPSPQSFDLTNGGGGTLNWNIIDDVTWLDVTPTNGVNSNKINVSVNKTNMTLGPYNAKITITSSDASNSPQVINVNYSITPNYPTTFTLSKTITFPTYTSAKDYKSTEYKLIGLPGKSDLPVKEILKGIQTKEWRVYWDNGLDVNYFKEFDGGLDFQFTAGKAFWVINNGPITIESTVPTVTLNSLYQAEVPLHSGWNIITNPMTKTYAWSDISKLNNVTSQLWKYEGTFSNSSTFEPYIGYYYDNSAKLPSLKIPFSSGSSLTKEDQIDDEWKVNIKLKGLGIDDNTTYFGITQNPNYEKEKYVLRKPRSLSYSTDIYFNNSKQGIAYNSISTDIRSNSDELCQWDLEILKADLQGATNESRQFKLTFSGINNVPLNYSIFLYDESAGKEIDLRKDTTYSFYAFTSITKMTIMVGKQEDIQKKQSTILKPKEYTIDNYPNPFNPTTNIMVTIPQIDNVKLIIYNIAGKELRLLHQGILPVGKHIFEWDGKDESGNNQPSGVYIYRLVGSNTIISNKMVLLK